MKKCIVWDRKKEDDFECLHIDGDKICLACEFKEIDVWRLNLKGDKSHLFDINKQNMQEIIKEDDENEYELKKVKMRATKYYSLPEFEGF